MRQIIPPSSLPRSEQIETRETGRKEGHYSLFLGHASQRGHTLSTVGYYSIVRFSQKILTLGKTQFEASDQVKAMEKTSSIQIESSPTFDLPQCCQVLSFNSKIHLTILHTLSSFLLKSVVTNRTGEIKRYLVYLLSASVHFLRENVAIFSGQTNYENRSRICVANLRESEEEGDDSPFTKECPRPTDQYSCSGHRCFL